MASIDQRRWGPDCQRRASCVGSPPSPRTLTANPSLTERLRAGGDYGLIALPDQVRQSSPSSSSPSFAGGGCSWGGGVGSDEDGATGAGGGCQPPVCGAAGVSCSSSG